MNIPVGTRLSDVITSVEGLGQMIPKILADKELSVSKEEYYITILKRRAAHLEIKIRQRNIRCDYDQFELEALLWALRELDEPI